MPVPGLSLLGPKRIRGFISILRYINPTIIKKDYPLSGLEKHILRVAKCTQDELLVVNPPKKHTGTPVMVTAYKIQAVNILFTNNWNITAMTMSIYST